MNSVTFPEALGGNGQTYTDDADPDTGLDGLGYTVRFVPCLQQAVVMGLSAQSNAQACADYVQQCQTLREEVGIDRQAVADSRTHVDQQKGLVDNAAGQVATDRQAVADDRTHVDQQKSLVDSAAQQVATDRQAVADDRNHVDQQKGLVDSAAQQVATDRQAVADDRLASQQAADASSDAADASIQARNEAQALYGDLNAVETAKTQAQQAATTATEKAGEASELLADAGTAYGADAQETLTDATQGRLMQVAAFGGYGSLGFSELTNPYPLNDVNTSPATVPSGVYAVTRDLHSNLPFPADVTFGAIEVKHLYSGARTQLIAHSAGVVTEQGTLSGTGDKYERYHWAVGGWVQGWRKEGTAKHRDTAFNDNGDVSASRSTLDLVDLENAVYAARYLSGRYFPSVSDFNIDVIVPGLCALVSTGNAGTWPDDIFLTAFVWLETQKTYTGTSCIQRITSYSSSGTSAPRSWIRVISNNGDLGRWAVEYNARNVIGTVSHSAGVPTGSLFEYDSNNIGEWQKTPDGVLDMWVETAFTGVGITIQEGSFFRSNELEIPLPTSGAVGRPVSFSIELQSGSGALLSASIARTRRSGNSLFFSLIKGVSESSLAFSVVAQAKTRWY